MRSHKCIGCFYNCLWNEPPHDKTNKMIVRPAKTQKAWVFSYPFSAQRRLWSDWVDAQADLSLRWAHSHIVGFVMRRLNLNFKACIVKK